MKFYEMESIKKLLGMPSRAGVKQVEARISELLAKEEELESLKVQSQEKKEPVKSWSWWRRRS